MVLYFYIIFIHLYIVFDAGYTRDDVLAARRNIDEKNKIDAI